MFHDRFTVTRDRLVGEIRDRHPFDRRLEELPIVTRADVDRLAGVRWVTRSGSGSYTFDWGAAAKVLERDLSPIEQRILRESVFESEPTELDDLISGLDALLAD